MKMFGSSAIYFSGTSSSHINVPAHPDFNMGTGDFTVEMWIKPHGSISWDDKGFFVLGASETASGTFSFTVFSRYFRASERV